MSLKCSLNSRWSGWTENAYLKNIATANRSYSFWVYSQSTPSGQWSITYLGWYENDWPYLPAGADRQGRVNFEKFPGHNLFFRARSQANATLADNGTGVINHANWHHVVVTVTDSTNVDVYVDTVNIAYDKTVPTTHYFGFGIPMKHVSGKTDGIRWRATCDCLIADLCVFDGVLSAGERTTLYAAGSPSYARTSVSPVATALLLRCPLEDHMKDVVSDTHIFGSQFAAVHVPESPFPDASTTNIIPQVENPGVCSRHLIGQRPDAFVLSLGDSFGTISAAKLNGPLLNKVSFIRPYESLMQMQTSPSSYTGNNGVITSIQTANEYRMETQTTRTITASSHSAGVLTLTYSGPNLVPGQTIKLGTNGSYLIVSTFIAGTGVGTSQTGAVVTCARASDPGSLVGDTIRSMCAFPGLGKEWYDNTGTATGIAQWSIYQGISAVYTASQLPMNGPLMRIADWYDCRNMKVRIWHRVASDPAIQVKSLKFQYINDDGTTSTGVTVSGLDNSDDAGKIKILGEFDVPAVRESPGGESVYNIFSFQLTPTGTAADSQDRYLCIVGYEVVYDRPDAGVRWMSTSESSWGFTNVGQTYPGLKQIDPFTAQSIALALVTYNPGRQFIITFDMDLENMTPAQWLACYEATKTTWDIAFSLAGGKPPKYLVWGYIVQEFSGGSLATNRGYVWNQNIGALNFARAHTANVEFISLYQISKGVFSPSFEQAVLPCGPNNCSNGNIYYFDDMRVTPTPVSVTDASWNNGTLTLTKTNGFRDHPYNAGSYWYKTYVYLEPTSKTGTPVVAGWYQVASMTVSTITLTATCTGGAAGVGNDVRVVALWTPMFTALHPGSGGVQCMADWIFSGLSASGNPPTKAQTLSRGLIG